LPLDDLDEFSKLIILKVQHGEVKLELFVVSSKGRLFEEFSPKGIKNLNDFDVRAPADHALQALHPYSLVDLSYLLHLPFLSVLRTHDMRCPSAVNVPAPGEILNIDALDELPPFPLKLSE
jgi:hypothetical protein